MPSDDVDHYHDVIVAVPEVLAAQCAEFRDDLERARGAALRDSRDAPLLLAGLAQLYAPVLAELVRTIEEAQERGEYMDTDVGPQEDPGAE